MYMVFDIGGTFVKYALLNESGNIHSKGRFATPKDSLNQLLKKMYSVVEEFRSQNLRGISICCPGVVDSYQGIVYYGGCLNYLHEENIKEKFIKKFHLPVSIENDGKAAALAELWRGGVDNSKHAVIMVLGSAIGGGIVIDGKLHRGQHFSAGEISYMVGDPIPCDDTYKMCGFDASAPRMVSDIAQINGLPEDTDGRIVFQHIKEENPASWNIFREYCKKIAKMIVSLQYIIDPERFIICGGISSQLIVRQQIMNEIREMYAKNQQYLLLPVVENSNLNNDANLYGALYHFFEEYVEQIEDYTSYNGILSSNCSTKLATNEAQVAVNE